jgi:DNA-binding transcriptional ArsR family regulator
VSGVALVQTPPVSGRRRKPFTAIRKGLMEHVVRGRIRGTAFALYVWLHMQADHTTGTVRTNAGRLSAELGLHPVTVRRDLSALKRTGYITYVSDRGSRQLYEIAIEKYHHHFDDTSRSTDLAEQEPLQAPLQVPLHERRANDRKDRANEPSKIIEVRSKREPTLRVRSADLNQSSEVVEAGSTRAHATAAAIAAAPVALRETLELFFLKTAREGLTADELDALRKLDAAHTTAVIQKAITAAVDRYTRRGQAVSDITLTYVWQSVQRFSTRKPREQHATSESGTTPYPPGVTRLR